MLPVVGLEIEPRRTAMSTALRLCVLALCCAAQLADAQVLGYISHSFSLIRSDTLENAEYKLVSNVTARDGYVSRAPTTPEDRPSD